MFGSDFWKIGGGPLAALLVEELDADAVDADLPVQVVVGVLKVSEYGNGHAQLAELVTCDGVEARVLKRTRHGVLAQARLQVHRGERSDAAAQPLVPANLPGHEQGAATILVKVDLGIKSPLN